MCKRAKAKKLRKPVVAVVDTNVFVSLLCAHDLHDVNYEAQEVKVNTDIILRRRRLREALLLGMFLHEECARTVSYKDELLTVVIRAAEQKPNPLTPNSQDPRPQKHRLLFKAFTGLTTRLFLARGGVFSSWIPTAFGTKESIKGTHVDRRLVEEAKNLGVPLLTFEGWGPEGLSRDKAIQRYAEKCGVTVLRPGQFYTDPAGLTTRFLNRLQNRLLWLKRPEYIRPDMLEATSKYLRWPFDNVVPEGLETPYQRALAYELREDPLRWG